MQYRENTSLLPGFVCEIEETTLFLLCVKGFVYSARGLCLGLLENHFKTLGDRCSDVASLTHAITYCIKTR